MRRTTDACKSICAQTLLRKLQQELHITSEKTDVVTCDLSEIVLLFFQVTRKGLSVFFPSFLKPLF